MKRKILNPYNKLQEHECFACSDHNPIGLKMEFYEEDELIKCDWQPEKQFQGYHTVIHGGIQATLLDEIGSWCVQVKLNTAGVTRNLDLKYRKPLIVDQRKATITAELLEVNRSLASIKLQIIDSKGVLCTEGTVEYFIFSEEMAKEKLYYPGVDAFFEK